MHQKSISALLAMIVIVCASFSGAQGQSARINSSKTPSSVALDPLALLPASDVVIDINVRRLLVEAIPRALAQSPAKMAQMNTLLNQIKASTGLDVRTIDRLLIGATAPNALGAGFGLGGPTAANEAVVIVQGRFDAEALITLGRLASGGKFVKQEHAGKSFYTFTLSEQVAQNSALPRQVNEAALAVFDQHTFALGTPAGVRASLEASQTLARSGVNAELTRLATLNPNVLICVALNFKTSTNAGQAAGRSARRPKRALDAIDLIGAPSAQNFPSRNGGTPDELKRILESIEGVYFSLGMSDTTLDALLVARTKTIEQANGLNEMLADLRRMFQGNAAQRTSAASLMNDLHTSVENNEVRIQAVMRLTDISAALADKPSNGVTKRPSNAGAARPLKTRRRS